MVLDDLLDSWRANNSVNLELLALCADEDLDLKPGKGKTIRSGFVHIVGVRRMHLEEKMRQQAQAVPKLDWQRASREEIVAALGLSASIMEGLFAKLEAPKKPGRWTLHRFFAYSIAHEAHHRAQIELALRLNGREPDDARLYELWNWPKK